VQGISHPINVLEQETFMTLVVLYLATATLFLVLDYVGLSYLIKPIFSKRIGHLMIEDFRVVPAALFYAFLVGVLLWFVSWPAISDGKGVLWVLGNAALLGAVTYGTFEFTALAILKDWSWDMVLADVVWGTCLTSVATVGGVWVTRLVR
jgi:uncharacterized membrane protein